MNDKIIFYDVFTGHPFISSKEIADKLSSIELTDNPEVTLSEVYDLLGPSQHSDPLLISQDHLETLMKLCFAEGLTCGADEEFWESVKDADTADYISERVKDILDSSGVIEKE
jgi:hypothetical protein